VECKLHCILLPYADHKNLKFSSLGLARSHHLLLELFDHQVVRGLYLAPHIPGGLRWSPGDFPESTWSPGAFFLAGSTAKLV